LAMFASLRANTALFGTLCLANSFIVEVRPPTPPYQSSSMQPSLFITDVADCIYRTYEDCPSPANRYCPSRDMTSRMTSAHAQYAAGSRRAHRRN